MQVLIAPDCYGDSLSAVEAADAIAAGWRRARPDDRLVLAPQSDGGPGFVGVLAGRLGEVRHTRVSGPLDGEVDAEWVYDPRTSTAYIECAQACGLSLLGGPPTDQTAVAAHSRGVGQLVDAALKAGATTIVVGLGGSACTDGGRGLIDAFGGLRQAHDELDGIRLIAATDVEHPLLGPMGAARIFGPQKGADPSTVEILEQRMTAWAAKLDALAGRPVSPLPGAGAAGGLGAALLALGAVRESGAAVIAEHTGLADDVARGRRDRHRRGPFRRPVAARQGGQRAGCRSAPARCPGDRAGRPGHARSRRAARGGYHRGLRDRRLRRVGAGRHRRRRQPAGRAGLPHGNRPGDGLSRE